MSLVVIPFTYTVGSVIIASQLNSCNSIIYSDYNGNITDANISASAEISDSKLSQITTASKVSGAALITLNLVPSGAGALPSKNGGTGADLSAALIGADPYFSATGVMSALAAGTSGQVKVSKGGAAPIWANALSSVSDYGTSASSSTARQATAIKIAYGLFSFAANGTQAITNLPFSSSTSYTVTIGMGYALSTTENIRVNNDSGTQFTLANDINRACTVAWHAIGT